MVRTGKKKKKSTTSHSAPRASFLSLPNDIALNILARISRIHYPILSLVSKSFSSLLSSRELYITRTLLEKAEKCFYLCLKLPDKRHWCTLYEQQKLIPIPLFPDKHPSSPTVVSNGSEIYIIGGYVRKRRSRNVFLLDCRSHKWCRLPNMLFPRGNAAAGLIQGKIYVFGGCYTPCNENWGEIYDPETESWELLSSTEFTPDLLFQKSVRRTGCFLGEEKIWCKTSVCSENQIYYDLIWCDLEDDLGWRKVKGLEGLHKVSPDFISVANSSVGGRRVTVMWVYKIYHPSSGNGFVCHVEIWCAEIFLERISREEVFGTVELCKMICTTDDSETGCGRLGSGVCLATITH